MKGILRWSQLSSTIKIGKYSYSPIPGTIPPRYAIVRSDKYDESSTDPSILNVEQKKISYVGSSNLSFIFRISHSDWTTDFYDAFGIGKVILIEAPSISQGNFDKGKIKKDREYMVLAERLESIGPYFQAMIESMKTGDWGEVVGKSRFIYESLIKSEGKQALRKFLQEDTNIDDANLSQLITSLDNMYQFSSGLHHSLDKSTGAPKEIYVGRREDAELMYYLSVSLVNALMSKLNRLS